MAIDHLLPLFKEARCGRKSEVSGNGGMVISSHPVSSAIAIDVMSKGGNACDAIVAASLGEVVIEPYLSSLMGGFSMLYYEAETKKFTYLNGNVDAPGAPLDGFGPDKSHSPLAVTVPGFWAAVEAAQERLGTRPVATLLAPAIALAEQGFPVFPDLWGEMFTHASVIGATAEGRDVYFRDGTLLRPGDTLFQPALARSLRRLAAEGSDYFYRGDFAKALCDQVRKAGGVITPEDFAAYQVRWEQPLRGTYREYDVITSPPPDMGGIHLIEMFNILEGLDLQKQGSPVSSIETLDFMTRMVRLVIDRGAQYGDPCFEDLALEEILSPEYARQSREELLKAVAMASTPQKSAGTQPPGSCHLSVVDPQGNIATVLHSQYCMPWAYGAFVDGISVSTPGCHFLRHMPPPGARASIMGAPNMLFRRGQPILASGSPSLSLLPAILQCTTAILDFGMTMEEAVHLPRFGGYSDDLPAALLIENDFPSEALSHLQKSGQPFALTPPWNAQMGAFEGIYFDTEGRQHACGDPRRTSCAKAMNGQ